MDENENTEGKDHQGYGAGYTPSSVMSAPQSISTLDLANYNTQSGDGPNGAFGNSNQLLGHFEPMLDADPFGLSASMHFPTPFSYEQNNTRQ